MNSTIIKKETQLKKEAYQLLNDLIKVVELNNKQGDINFLSDPEFI